MAEGFILNIVQMCMVWENCLFFCSLSKNLHYCGKQFKFIAFSLSMFVNTVALSACLFNAVCLYNDVCSYNAVFIFVWS